MPNALVRQVSNTTPAKIDPVDQLLKGAAEKAARYLEGLVDDKEASTKHRSEAARTILDRSGYGPQSRPAAPPAKQNKDLSDMSAGELRDLMQALQVQLSNRATVIDAIVEPSGAPDDTQLSEMLE